MQRPTGVSVVSVLLWISGVVNVISGFGIMSSISTGWGLLQVAIGAAAIAFGIGCWQLKAWAWAGTIGLMGLNIVSMLIVWMRFREQIVGGRVIAPLIINAVVIFYLLQPNVKAAFEQ